MEVVTSLCVCSIHLRIKAARVRARVRASIFVFLFGKQADFRALGIKLQRSSSSLSALHIYSIGGEEKPWCVPSAVAINSLETSPSPADFKEP